FLLRLRVLATAVLYALSLHDALPILTQLELMPKPPLVRLPENPWPAWPLVFRTSSSQEEGCTRDFAVMTKAFLPDATGARVAKLDRKSTRLNSSHSQISYAVFCLKKK